MDVLRRWRQPAAFVVLGALVARLVLGVVGLVVFADEQGYGSVVLAAASMASLVLDTSGLLLLALLVAACRLVEPTSHSRFLVGAAFVVSALTVLLTLGFALTGPFVDGESSGVHVAERLVSLVPPAVITVGLGLLWRAPARTAALETATREPDREQAAPAVASAPTTAPTDPVWAPEEAAGAVWHTAGSAAAGGAAAAWGSADAPAGWNPVPGPAQPPALGWSRDPYAPPDESAPPR